ncbi:MAG: DUF58 domain-containing protein [Clostridia bacterium]|nr:DUF58 domain-containing protein [Clostridia bacterium]
MTNILWIALLVAVMVLIQSLLLSKLALKNVSYTRTFSKTKLYEGEELEMIEVISNRKLLPVPWIRVETRLPRELRIVGNDNQYDIQGDMYHRSAFTLAPYQQITRRHRVKVLKRGYYSASTASLTSGDLFGMSNCSKQVELDLFVTCYPAPVPVEDIPLPSLKWQGELVVKRYIMPDVFLYGGIRDYTIGDPIKTVHWGATASTGVLKVKQNDYTAQPRLLIALNVQPTESVWGEVSPSDMPDIERGIALASSLAAYLLENGLEVGFATNGRYKSTEDTVYIEPANSYEQGQLLLDCFAKLQVYRQRSFHQFLESLPNFRECDVLVITCYVNKEIEDAAADIRSKGNSVGYYMLRSGGEGA